MTRSHTTSRPMSAPVRSAAIAAAALAVLLAGCGGDKDRPATQTAARVNKEEITVHQINYVLSQQRGLQPAQAASAGKQALERLIDQELALQQAYEQKVDRDPAVAQQLEASRREIIARAYLEKIGAGAPRPAPEEIKKYYDEHPALFKQRRIYTLQELAIEAKPDQVEPLRKAFGEAKDIGDFVNWLKANDFRFTGNQGVRAAEQIPLTMLPTFAEMKDGQTLFNRTGNGVQVVVLVGSRSQPIDEARAQKPIEAFLVNERKRKVIEDDLKALRAAAQIEYVGDYAQGAAAPASAPLAVRPSVSPLTAAPASAPEFPAESASAPSGSALEQGLRGLK